MKKVYVAPVSYSGHIVGPMADVSENCCQRLDSKQLTIDEIRVGHCPSKHKVALQLLTLYLSML
eukprot:5157833-Pleurochrysis_carterae.AAC.1